MVKASCGGLYLLKGISSTSLNGREGISERSGNGDDTLSPTIRQCLLELPDHWVSI